MFLKRLLSVANSMHFPTSHLHTLPDGFVARIESQIGSKQVFHKLAKREQFGKDESLHKLGTPSLVVSCKSVDEVSTVVKLCHESDVSIIPFGSGTGLEGGVCPPVHSPSVTIDMSGMTSIHDYEPQDFIVSCQPGVVRSTLNHFLKLDGLFFPIDPGADCSLCGMCATSASGTNAVKYGSMKDNVINLEVVLPSGQIIRTQGNSRAKKSSAGYNLTNLFVGSEGTLGIITEATLKVYGIPEKSSVIVCGFESLESAVSAVTSIMSSGIIPSRIELLDDCAIEASNKFSHLDNPVIPATLFIEITGSENSVPEEVEVVKELSEDGRCLWRSAEKTEDVAKLWQARHNLLYATKGLLPGCNAFLTDVCVSQSKLVECITTVKTDIDAHKLLASIIGHVGDGNFHVLFPYLPDDSATLDLIREVADRLVRNAISLGGTCTGEHGIGLGKRKYLVEELGEGTVNVMQQIKHTLDPKNIMNPGKIFFDSP